MPYYFNKTINHTFQEATQKIKEGLQQEGFGVLTEIDVRQTLKNKLNVEFPKYIILGACNPKYAYKALQMEDKIGTMLPCNVILQEKSATRTEVSAIDPVSSMAALGNPQLNKTAIEVASILKKVIDNL